MKNREIKFRAREIGSNEWVYGYYCKDYSGTAFITSLDGTETSQVDEETLGQYTGLKDNNGTMIFEGDVLIKEGNPKYTKKEYLNQIFTVKFNNEYSRFICIPHKEMPDNGIFMPHIYMCKIIGNIHESPEILNG